MDDFKKRLIIILVIALAIVLISGGLFYYFRHDITKRAEQINIYRVELVSRATILNRIHLLEQEHAYSTTYFEKLKAGLPTETEMVGLEEVLQNLASQNDLNLSFRFGVLNEEKDLEPKNYSFNLILSGEKNNILKWLDSFQKLTYSVRLEQIELTQINASKDKFYYDVKILGRIYLR